MSGGKLSRSVNSYSVQLDTNDRQAAKAAIEALGSDIPKPEFIDLLAGWDTFTRTGAALPHETLEYAFFLLHRKKIMSLIPP